MKKALITGATGFLGEYLLKELLEQFDCIYVLSRSPKKLSHHEKIVYVSGDITHFDVISEKDPNRETLFNEVTVVIHAAALYNIASNYSESFLQNVVGTQNILHLLKNIKQIESFFYVSTVAIADPNLYFLEEDSFPERLKFEDAYSETKYMAEKLVRENLSARYKTRIFRPAIVIGDSNGTKMNKIDGPYIFIEAFKKYQQILKNLPVIPLCFNPRAKLSIIPVDHCAKAMAKIIKIDQSDLSIKTFHLVSQDLPTISEFLADLSKKLGINSRFLPVKRNIIHQTILKQTGIPKEVIPFMFSRISYDRTNTIELCPELAESSYKDFKHILLEA